MSRHKAIEQEIEEDVSEESHSTEPPNYLSETALYFREVWKDKIEASVPPPTPDSVFEFESTFQSIPTVFPKLETLEIPYVREVGVQKTIEILANFFGCTEYKTNLFQFWFLDIMTDCLWKTQDEFRFQEKNQRVVLSWILYIFNIIRDPNKNFSRKKTFKIFKESILIAGELVDERVEMIPSPEDVISIVSEDGESNSSRDDLSSNSSLSLPNSNLDNKSYLEIQIENEEPHVFVIPKEACNCEIYELSSIDTISETPLPSSHHTESENQFDMLISPDVQVGEEEETILEEIEFYKSDPNIPARFLPLDESIPEEEQSEFSFIECQQRNQEENVEDKPEISEYDIEEASGFYDLESNSQLLTQSVDTCPSSIFSKQTENEELKAEQIKRDSKAENGSLKKKKGKKRILSQLKKFKLWEQRMKDMDDPKKGWLPPAEEEVKVVEEETGEISDEDEWMDIIDKKADEIQETRDRTFVNFGVLWAIIDFIFNYFYESFQFTLIKLAFQAHPNIIKQKVNDEWREPKLLKDELIKPPPKKKEKPKKEKKPKKPPKPKKDKSSKASKSKKPKKEKAKKEKKQKPKPLTKEEKAELERQRQEQLKLEEELRLIEENRRFMFPLGYAANDILFKEIFENWVKVDLDKVLKKGGKKDKGKKKK